MNGSRTRGAKSFLSTPFGLGGLVVDGGHAFLADVSEATWKGAAPAVPNVALRLCRTPRLRPTGERLQV